MKNSNKLYIKNKRKIIENRKKDRVKIIENNNKIHCFVNGIEIFNFYFNYIEFFLSL